MSLFVNRIAQLWMPPVFPWLRCGFMILMIRKELERHLTKQSVSDVGCRGRIELPMNQCSATAGSIEVRSGHFLA